jgi:hypothetical protein
MTERGRSNSSRRPGPLFPIFPQPTCQGVCCGELSFSSLRSFEFSGFAGAYPILGGGPL